jgi:hypothetical protein
MRASQPLNKSLTGLVLADARISIVQTTSNPVQYLFHSSSGLVSVKSGSELRPGRRLLLYVITEVRLAPGSFTVRLTIQSCLLLGSLSFFYSSSHENGLQSTTISPFVARPSLSSFPFVYVCLFLYGGGVKQELYLLGGGLGGPVRGGLLSLLYDNKQQKHFGVGSGVLDTLL